MDMLVYRLNMCISEDDHKQRIEVLEELIYKAQKKIKLGKRYVKPKGSKRSIETNREF